MRRPALASVILLVLILCASPLHAQEDTLLPDDLPIITLDNAPELEMLAMLRSTRVEQLEWSPDGRWLASATADGMIELWDIEGAPPPSLRRTRLAT